MSYAGLQLIVSLNINENTGFNLQLVSDVLKGGLENECL